MKYIYTKNGLAALEAFCFSNSLFAFDFDGTLSPIVKQPDAAIMNAKTKKLLEELCSIKTVAVISGRSLGDVKSRINIDSLYVIGNHGLEGLKSFKISYENAEINCKHWLGILNSKFSKIQGVELEDKKFSLAIHYRNSRNKTIVRSNIIEEISQLNPAPRIIFGKSVVNLIPVGAPHKGIALMELMIENKKTSAVYVGDDYTDEDIFSLPEERLLKIRVGNKINSSAEFYIKRQSEINKLLQKIIKYSRS